MTDQKPATNETDVRISREWFRGPAAWLIALLLGFCAGHKANGTEVDTVVVRCPVCQRVFAIQKILSWNMGEGPGGPPTLYAVCPECLYTTAESFPIRAIFIRCRFH